jgi:hypothetical protein
LFATAPAQAQTCTGDCDGNGSVGISELVLGVNISLGSAELSRCAAFDCQGNGMVPVNCLIQGVNRSLEGCTPGTPRPTATATPTGGTTNCPLEPGHYTITQGAGGRLVVATFSEFPFPTGGTVKMDVGPGDTQCRHEVVVPEDDGFSAPTFCIQALGLSVHVAQDGCGIGRIASMGGADFTIAEVGDTSDTNGPCHLPQTTCQNTLGEDSSVRVNLKVGDGTPDTCAGGGTANAILAIPVHTQTWQERSSGASCPANDGTYNPPVDPNNVQLNEDLLVVEFPQVLDFTTDTTTVRWSDLDGDGCFIAGFGPPAGMTATDPAFSREGTCMDLDAKTVTTVATGPVGSSGGPTYDISFATFLPNTYVREGDSQNATCANPPTINLDGETDRCIEGQ